MQHISPLRLGTILFALMAGSTAVAQDGADEAAPTTGEAAASECFPTCREGYLCHRGQCVSQCNPPCADDEVCSPDATCVPKPPPPSQTPPPAQGGWQQAPAGNPPPAAGSPSGWDTSREPPASGLVAPGVFRLQFTFDPGFGGTYSLDADDGVDSFDGEADLATTFGLRLQGQFSLGRYLYLGLNFGFDSLQTEFGADEDLDRVLAFGIGPAFGFRYAIDAGAVAIEPTAGISLGLGILSDNELNEAVFGVEFGFRAGVNVWLTEAFGLHLNVGYQLHRFFDEAEGFDIIYGLGQMRLGLGVSLRLGT